MADNPSSAETIIDYQALVLNAMRDVPRRALMHVAEHGLPGEHHFYITFRMDHPGVQASPVVRKLHPKELTIVLQHQFWNLQVDEHEFVVTLRFAGAPEHLRVPFEAVTAFVDPSVKFGLQWKTPEDAEPKTTPQAADAAAPPAAEAPDRAAGPRPATPATVVDFSAFRKNAARDSDS